MKSDFSLAFFQNGHIQDTNILILYENNKMLVEALTVS